MRREYRSSLRRRIWRTNVVAGSVPRKANDSAMGISPYKGGPNTLPSSGILDRAAIRLGRKDAVKRRDESYGPAKEFSCPTTEETRDAVPQLIDQARD